MRIRNTIPALALALFAGFSSTSASAEVTANKDYLLGTWSLEGSDSCHSTGKENVEFRADNTLSLGSGGRADSAGFFELSGDRMDLHMVASPNRGSSAVPHEAGQYGYGHLAVFFFNVEQDSFEAVVPFEGDLRRRVAHRCK